MKHSCFGVMQQIYINCQSLFKSAQVQIMQNLSEILTGIFLRGRQIDLSIESDE